MKARKTLLFYDDFPWIKKGGKEAFDISMGCSDVTECYKLVGSYIVDLLYLTNIMLFYIKIIAKEYLKTNLAPKLKGKRNILQKCSRTVDYKLRSQLNRNLSTI